MKTFQNKLFIIFLSALLLSGSQAVMAQLNPLAMQYYSNQYLGNPAMAGVEAGIKVNLGYRQQWTRIPGAPSTQAITAEYGTDKVGIGVNMNNDAAGLLKRTRVAATYAYHLPLNADDQKLHFGVSLGVMFERVENQLIDGDATDGSLDRFARRENYLDGDFGIAYTAKGLTLQAAIPNLQQFVRKNENIKSVDRSLFLAAVGYRFNVGPEGAKTSFEPKVTFRGVKGYNNIIDAGFNLGLVDDKVNILGMYHSSNSATFGLGTVYKSFSIMGLYTTETAALRSYIDGDFQITIGYKFAKGQKE